MLHLSTALVLIAIIFSYKPPTFKYHKKIEVEHTYPEQTTETTEDLEKLNDNKPPTIDDMVSTLNTFLHDLEEDNDR